jgi:dTDP-4-amino-4,6-dideoxygalactose transaminase
MSAGTETVSLSEPALGQEEKQALCDVIDSGWLTMGERVAAFERDFAKLHGVESAVAVNSCTAGLHLCLLGLGVQPGDEVLVPSVTFVATVNAVLYVGALPVFVDIEQTDLPHISIADAQGKLTARTKAAILMHYGGYLVDLPAWRSFADAHGMLLIEDAAHAPAVGEVGKWGDASAFSFFTNKNMTTAEGGMVLARDAAVTERIRLMRAHGMTTGTLERYRGHAFSYDVTTLGYNYRMDELRAAMGLAQLARLPKWNARRRELTAVYRRLLAEALPEVAIPFGPLHETAAHIMPVLLPRRVSRDAVMAKLFESGIQSSVHYPPVHRFSYYRERFPDVSLSNTDEFVNRVLTLPLHPGLDERDVGRVVVALKNAMGEP